MKLDASARRCFGRFVRNAENNHQAQSSGLFQSAMVSSYCSYLVRNPIFALPCYRTIVASVNSRGWFGRQELSAVINHPEDRCRPFDDTYDTTLRLAGCIFVFMAVRLLKKRPIHV